MKLNTQPPDRVIKSNTSLLVHSIFNTIQGEGPFAGERAVFIRLAGCNLQCPLCDTEYTKGAMPYTTGTLVTEVLELVYPVPNLIVLTGGEPFRQPIGPYVRALIAAGFEVQIETNGTLYRNDLPYMSSKLTIVCSPKTHFVHPDLLPYIKALKYVATADSIDPTDGLPTHALEHPRRGKLFRPPVDFAGTVYIQPVDEQDDTRNAVNLHAVVRSVQRHGYRLCLQLHKIIGLA
jgi:organic radical activating enzyme